jgi:peptidoglycan/LPS O-acetylase OafA/YrhL
MAGIALRICSKRKYDISTYTHFAFVTGSLIAIGFLTYGADELDLVTGLRRAALVLISVFIVGYAANVRVPEIMERMSELLGGLSYPLYLAHPLAFFAFASVLKPTVLSLITLFIGLIFASIIVDRFFDRKAQIIVRRHGW